MGPGSNRARDIKTDYHLNRTMYLDMFFSSSLGKFVTMAPGDCGDHQLGMAPMVAQSSDTNVVPGGSLVPGLFGSSRPKSLGVGACTCPSSI